MLFNKILFGILVLLPARGWSADAGQVARVATGELKEARASWWGFAQGDATRALQAAIDSRVPRLIVDHMGSPWITDRLTCVSDQEIVFEPGVEVLAKKDAFPGLRDALFSLISVTNVTLRGPGAVLRMRRADYDAPPYEKAEWRHVLNLLSSVNVMIEGLTLTESGGDGIYLGVNEGHGPNRNIRIRNVVCDRNYRQGISVISVEGLLIENTVMRGTSGTPPSAGIDFEPNFAHEILKDCVLRNCLCENNKGNGYACYLATLTRDSEPVSIRFENCRSTGNETAAWVFTGNPDARAVRGSIVFSDCRFEGSSRAGIVVVKKPAYGLMLAFDRCRLDMCGPAKNGGADIQLSNNANDEWPVGGIRFDGLTVSQPFARPWIKWAANTTIAEPPPGLTGMITVESPALTLGLTAATEQVNLTPAWVAKNLPPLFTVRVPRVAGGDLSKARVTDLTEGVRTLSPLRLRRTGTYVFYTRAGQDVVLAGMQTQVGSSAAVTKPLVVRTRSKTVLQVPLPGFKTRVELRFVADQGGFCSLDVDTGENAFTLLEANVPVALIAPRKTVGLVASEGSLYVPIPAGTSLFAFGIAGGGPGEPVKAAVIDPSGKRVWMQDGIVQMERFTSSKEQGSSGGLWEIRFAAPSQGLFEDFKVEVLGVPEYLFLDQKRYWK